MTKYEMKRDVLALIEELNPDSEYLTDDPDISAKIDSVMNHVQNEIARFKHIPRYVEMSVKAGDLVDFEQLANLVGNEIYQIAIVRGVKHEYRAEGTVVKFLEDGTAEIDVFIYPTQINAKTKDKAHEFELSIDALEIMVYGVAADLLKSDESANYGQIYANRYTDMMERLNSRYAKPTITVEGGVVV